MPAMSLMRIVFMGAGGGGGGGCTHFDSASLSNTLPPGTKEDAADIDL